MKYIIASLLMFFSIHSYASQNATTNTGDIVILNDDGTWSYVSKENDVENSEAIELNSLKFSKPKNSTFLLKSTRNDTAVWINPKKWYFKKSNSTRATEYKLRLKNKSLYAMMITEEIELPLETIMEAALNNARNAAPNSKIIKKEYRMVNGKKVLYMEITGSLKKVNFTYISYNFSNSSGSTQLVTYTANNLIKKYQPDIYQLLNGLVTQ